MSEPRRLLQSSSAASRLLRAGLRDNPQPRAARRAALVLGLGAASASAATGASALGAGAASTTIAATAASTATGASVSMVAVAAKWALVGVLGGTVAAGGATAIATLETSSTQQRTVETPSRMHAIDSPRVPLARPRTPAPAAAPNPTAEPGDPNPAIGRAPRDTPSKHSSPALTPRATAAATVREPSSGTRAPADSPSGDTGGLGRDLTHIDAARSALRAGDTKRAEALLDRYEHGHKTNFFEREALVLRIEALVHQGEQRRAAALASEYFRRFPDDAHARRIRALLGVRPSE